MKKTFLSVTCALTALCLFSASLADATPFTVSGSNNPTAYIAISDAYLLPMIPVAVTTPASPWVSGSWMTFNNPDQSWPMDSGSGNLPGTYLYFTAFDLTGLDASTAILNGSWASDNGAECYLNDMTTPVSTSNGYGTLTNFTINSGFHPGFNSLAFEVTNDPYGSDPSINPTGLLVNIYEANANPVPEPSTMMLLGLGMLGLAVYGKCRMNKDA